MWSICLSLSSRRRIYCWRTRVNGRPLPQKELQLISVTWVPISQIVATLSTCPRIKFDASIQIVQFISNGKNRYITFASLSSDLQRQQNQNKKRQTTTINYGRGSRSQLRKKINHAVDQCYFITWTSEITTNLKGLNWLPMMLIMVKFMLKMVPWYQRHTSWHT